MAAYTRDQMLDVLRRTMDEGFLEPLLGDPDSAAVVAALADIGSRLSQAMEHDCSTGLITLAPAGRPGTSEVTVTRTGFSTQTLPRGTLFEDARGVLFYLQQDIVFPPGPITTPLNVASLRQTELVNTVNDPIMRFAPSTIVADVTGSAVAPIVIETTTPHKFSTGTLVRVTDVTGNTAANGVFSITVIDPNTFSLDGSSGNGNFTGGGIVQRAPLGLIITESTPVQGGASDYLALLGKERGQLRQAGEQAEDYRARVRNIPDSVSPKAIVQAARGAAQAVGLPDVLLLEPFEDLSTPATDADIGLGSFSSLYWFGTTFGSGTPSDYAGTPQAPLPFSWDDPAAIYLDRHTACAYFKITFQAAVDGSTALPADPDESRAFYDNFFWDDPMFGFYDVGVPLAGTSAGTHPAVLAAMMSLWEEINRKRALCVRFDVEIIPYKTKVFMGDLATGGAFPQVVVFTATPPAGKVWFVEDIVAGHLGVSALEPAPACSHSVRVTFEDATVFTTPSVNSAAQAVNGADHTHILKDPGLASGRATQVQGRLGSTGGINTRLVVVLRVLEVTA